MTRAHHYFGVLMALPFLMASLSTCADESPDQVPAATCSMPETIDTPAGLPGDFPWPDGMAVTEAQLEKNFVALEGFSESSVEQLFGEARTTLLEHDFDIINTDFEGFEAELYFAKSASLAGIVSLREGPCDGYVKVNVIYDPLETAAGRRAVKKTRRLSGEG